MHLEDIDKRDKKINCLQWVIKEQNDFYINELSKNKSMWDYDYFPYDQLIEDCYSFR